MSARPDPRLPSTPLRSWRQSAGACSWAELARRTGVSRRTILSAAAGRAVSLATARAIRRETGLSLDELLADAITEPPSPGERRARVAYLLDRPRVAKALSLAGMGSRRRTVDL